MMADLKEHGSVASVLTMAVSEMVQRRDEVVERRLSFQKERFLSQCSGKVEEQRTLKEVERRFSTLVDEALRGERNKANLRQFGTNLLKLRVDMDYIKYVFWKVSNRNNKTCIICALPAKSDMQT